MVALPTVMISSQKLSCTAGQWYFVRTRWTTTSVIVDSDDAMVLGGLRVVICFREGGALRVEVPEVCPRRAWCAEIIGSRRTEYPICLSVYLLALARCCGIFVLRPIVLGYEGRLRALNRSLVGCLFVAPLHARLVFVDRCPSPVLLRCEEYVPLEPFIWTPRLKPTSSDRAGNPNRTRRWLDRSFALAVGSSWEASTCGFDIAIGSGLGRDRRWYSMQRRGFVLWMLCNRQCDDGANASGKQLQTQTGLEVNLQGSVGVSE
jgi:hypothetical protein